MPTETKEQFEKRYTVREGVEVSSVVTMALVKNARVNIFEYEGEAHARLHKESDEHKGDDS